MRELLKIERVSFDSEGIELVGQLAVPQEITFPRPAVLICPATGMTKESYSDLLTSLCQAGLVALSFDYRGHGESAGEFDFVKAYHHDAPAALAFLAGQEAADSQRMGVFGHSLGINIAIWSAKDEPRIRAIALWAVGGRVSTFYEKNPVDILAVIMPRVRGVHQLIARYKEMGREQFMKLVSHYDAVENIGALPPRPVLIVQGDSDAFWSLDDAYELRDRGAPSTTVVVIEGGDHVFSRQREVAIGTTVDWLRKNLV